MSKRRVKIGKIFAGGLASLAVVFAVAVAPVSQVSAATNAMGATETYFNWGCPTDQGGKTIECFLLKILNWAAIGVTIAVVGGIVYGAILYTTAGGKSDQAKKGMNVIRGAIIALLLYFAMFAVINFLVPGGLFRSS